MKKLILYQVLALFLLTISAWLWQGEGSALSVFLGGAAYALPTLIAVIVLYFTGHSPIFSTVGFIYAESAKVLLSLLWMAAVFLIYPQVKWVYFFIGLLIVSHCIFFVFGEVVNHGKRKPR